MNPRDSRLDWIQRFADGLASEEEAGQLERALRDDPELRAAYLEYTNIDSALEAMAAASEAEATEKLISFPRAHRWRWAAAAAALVVFIGAWFALRTPGANGPRVTAQVIEAEGAEGWRAGASVALRKLSLARGDLLLRLESGALVSVRAPAEMEFLDPMRLRVSKGQVTTDVGDNAKGFTVETAQTQVVDLGTKFGVEVSDSGHTDVVVFQGKVELYDRQRHNSDAPFSQLTEGEAVRVDARQQLTRIVNVTSGPHKEQWSSGGPEQTQSVIASVRDNLRDPQARYFYRIVPGGLQEDVRAFVGQRHEWNGLDANGIAPWLLGADLVQTFMSDRLKTSLELTVTVARPAVLYVFFDDRKEHPAWLSQNFTDTGAKIGLEFAPPPSSGRAVAKGPGAGTLARLSVWKREMPQAGSITLGPPHSPDEISTSWNWMYGIAAKPL